MKDVMLIAHLIDVYAPQPTENISWRLPNWICRSEGDKYLTAHSPTRARDPSDESLII